MSGSRDLERKNPPHGETHRLNFLRKRISRTYVEVRFEKYSKVTKVPFGGVGTSRSGTSFRIVLLEPSEKSGGCMCMCVCVRTCVSDNVL